MHIDDILTMPDSLLLFVWLENLHLQAEREAQDVAHTDGAVSSLAHDIKLVGAYLIKEADATHLSHKRSRCHASTDNVQDRTSRSAPRIRKCALSS